jgi:ornithine cyclodeaminase/alanine dehydrogenase-like protein (mu-crystallin family)
MSIRYIPEEISARVITHELAINAVAAALMAATDPQSTSFPVVLGHSTDRLNRFSIKSATTRRGVGVKIGSYWHRNVSAGLPCHHSCILLFDEKVGRIDTIIEASLANGYRTAAANALAVQHLSRQDASCLAIFGAGNQAYHECAAVVRVRSIERICIVNRDFQRARQFEQQLKGLDPTIDVRITTQAEAIGEADIIVTATAARSPLFAGDIVRPGTHVSCMGTDAVGKQEIPPSLLRRAVLFCDYLEQSLLIGELQHVSQAVRDGELTPTNLGEVLAGRHPGRTDPSAITIFDSSGLALQDLFLAVYLLEEAERQSLT